MTRKFLMAAWLVVATMTFAVPAQADKWTDTIDLFKNAGESREFFGKSYGYAVFPTVGKGGFVVGGAYGEGRVYRGGGAVGRTDMKQVSVGWQLGAQGYSLIIFFEDKRAFDDFTSGKFEFGAQASAVAITAGATAAAGTTGATAGASAGKKDATTKGGFNEGMAAFTIVKGGLMYEVALAGATFSYKPMK